MNISKCATISFFYMILCFSCQSEQKKQVLVATEKTNTAQMSTGTADKKTSNASNTMKILFFGDSLTAGYQLNEEESYPAIIQQKIDSVGYDYEVINAGLSGETTSGGLNRIDWVLNQPIDIFVLELGANDALRGLDLGATKDNLHAIIAKVQEKNADVKIIIAGMLAPPNLGTEYTTSFNAIFTEVADVHDIGLIPFLLDGVAGDPKLNLTDGIHPNANGYKIVAENVWSILKAYL